MFWPVMTSKIDFFYQFINSVLSVVWLKLPGHILINYLLTASKGKWWNAYPISALCLVYEVILKWNFCEITYFCECTSRPTSHLIICSRFIWFSQYLALAIVFVRRKVSKVSHCVIQNYSIVHHKILTMQTKRCNCHRWLLLLLNRKSNSVMALCICHQMQNVISWLTEWWTGY